MVDIDWLAEYLWTAADRPDATALRFAFEQGMVVDVEVPPST